MILNCSEILATEIPVSKLYDYYIIIQRFVILVHVHVFVYTFCLNMYEINNKWSAVLYFSSQIIYIILGEIMIEMSK